MAAAPGSIAVSVGSGADIGKASAVFTPVHGKVLHCAACAWPGTLPCTSLAGKPLPRTPGASVTAVPLALADAMAAMPMQCMFRQNGHMHGENLHCARRPVRQTPSAS